MAGAVEERAGLPVDGWVPPMQRRQDLVLDAPHGGLLVQLLACGAVALYAAAATAGILLVINLIVPIRVPTHAEEAGLDLAQHGEVAYQL